MTPYPTVGLVVTPRTDLLLARFLTVVARWCKVSHAGAGESIDAWVVSDDADPTLVAADVPVLVWTRNPHWVHAQRWPLAAILIGPHVPNGTVGPHRSLFVPEPAVDASVIPYVPPLIRQRWRRRFGLPNHMVVELDVKSDLDFPIRLRAAALSVTAVAVATGDGVLTSLAWGAPTVTNNETARRLGLGSAVRAVAGEHLAEAARELAQSETQMSDLSWTGRQLAEERFDLAIAAFRAVEAAELWPGEDRSYGVLSRLNELWSSSQTAWSIVREISK